MLALWGLCVLLSQEPERWAAEAPRLVSAESSGASTVTEWVLERQAEKCWVTVKVNKIKAGNLRASVLHKRCRQQWGGSVKDEGGWEDYRLCVRRSAQMCVCVCLVGRSSPTLQAMHCDRMMRFLYWVCVQFTHCAVRLCSVNRWEAARLYYQGLHTASVCTNKVNDIIQIIYNHKELRTFMTGQSSCSDGSGLPHTQKN